MVASAWALDTNVLVRYYAQDDAKQAAAATRFIEKDLSASRRGFISLVVLMETVWVMQSRYAADNTLVAELLSDLLDTAELEVQEAPAVRKAVLRFAEGGVDFHDCLIVSLADLRRAQVVTFDSKAAKRLSMELLR
jgi:predicted nucleic-acid-binding protein